jgi:hypothetical protein
MRSTERGVRMPLGDLLRRWIILKYYGAKGTPSTQLLIKIKHHNFSNVFRLDVLSHLQSACANCVHKRTRIKLCAYTKHDGITHNLIFPSQLPLYKNMKRKTDNCNANIYSNQLIHVVRIVYLYIFFSNSLNAAEHIKPKHVVVVVIFNFVKYLFWRFFVVTVLHKTRRNDPLKACLKVRGYGCRLSHLT